jgi:uncharacterized protein YbjQ (UPF0145 family)
MPYFSPIPIYTTELINPDPKKYVVLGLVVGNDRERISLARHVGESFMGIFGWSSGLMRKKMNDLVENAKADLMKQVAQKFPNATAVYGADFNFNTTVWHLDLNITGTAVIEVKEVNKNIDSKKTRRSSNMRKNRTRRSL